ncbi:CRISPR-associated endonuclease Cas1 [Parendozoicomonas haliclonae]|uniref:CRISPR-associated endonuclease Cas1 n=1 Tax=Parendozoicomonas haliclonae TaxID=1960125 RepID=A0A1X7AI41_9GAMM|nr:CRISPR-associated endonuclease Cas1 [Parendozoicomonas haliclonae]SMA42948.1 CRISPR-associated endonuclease Cas1 [Parendozoicomonas haliclonae]
MHITISEYGQALGVTSARLTVSEKGHCIQEYPLSRIKTISVAKGGVSISSNLITACALRGIKLFVLDWRPRGIVCLQGSQQHAVVRIRQKQFEYLGQPENQLSLCKQMIIGKIKNQRGVLKYFGKYSARDPVVKQTIDDGALSLARYTDAVKKLGLGPRSDWRSQLMGYEGQSAKTYWQILRECSLLPASFPGRLGRSAPDVGNIMLNYGYAILSSYIWHCVINAGLEGFAGGLHTERPGKPSLVLDIMEEYRPWVVDRNVIKLRDQASEKRGFDSKLKRKLGASIHETFRKKYPYKNRKVSLESILQRQVYRLAGEFSGQKTYKPYLFRW